MPRTLNGKSGRERQAPLMLPSMHMSLLCKKGGRPLVLCPQPMSELQTLQTCLNVLQT